MEPEKDHTKPTFEPDPLFEEIFEEVTADAVPELVDVSMPSRDRKQVEGHQSGTEIPEETLVSIAQELRTTGFRVRALDSLSLGGHTRLTTFRSLVEALEAYPFRNEEGDSEVNRGLHCFQSSSIGSFVSPLLDIRSLNHPKKKFVIAVNVDCKNNLDRDLSNVTVALSELRQTLPWNLESIRVVVLPPEQYAKARELSRDAAARSRYLQVVDPAKNPNFLAVDLIQLLVDMPGSDLHLDFTASGNLVPQIRKDGLLQALRLTGGKKVELPRTRGNSLMTIFMNLAGLDIADKGSMQDGKVQFSDPDFMGKHSKMFQGADPEFVKKLPSYSLRVSYAPTVTGAGLTVRLLHSQKEGRDSLEDSRLGLHNVEALRETLSLTTGLVAVSGPTGSGKSTTLYRALSEANTGERKLSTIEEPVERILPLARQIEIGTVRTSNKARAGFADALRVLVRQDPDIILVGETRDFETAEAAIHAALTGHLVFTSVHANDAIKTFERFLDFRDGPAEIDRGSFLNAIQLSYAQRLVRQFCGDCVDHQDLSEQFNQFFELSGDENVSGLELPVATGTLGGSDCPSCFGTGYVDRLPLGEYLKVDDSFADLVRSGSSTKELREFAIRNGNYKPFAWDGFRLVLSGQSDLGEICRVWDTQSLRREKRTFLKMVEVLQNPDALQAAHSAMGGDDLGLPLNELTPDRRMAIENFLLGRLIADWCGEERGAS